MGDPFFANHAQVRTVQKFEATAEIVLNRGANPPGNPRAYGTDEVLGNLSAPIQRPS